ncbi:hypothetical protein ACOMHN_004439 [Nucella lapillus]
MSFTLFVLLPNQDVCSLRRLHSRSSISAVRKHLELSAGLPAQTYDLACPDGKLLADDTLLQLDKNVWDGYILRVIFRNYWLEVFDAVVMNDVDHVLEQCCLHVPANDLGDGKVKDMMRKERGVVALFMASFLGLVDLCSALLCAGVDPDGQTPFGRTPLFAAMSCDHAHVAELLLAHNATPETRDRDGTSAADAAREHEAKECLRKVRQLKLYSRVSSAASSKASGTSARGSNPLKAEKHAIRIPTGTEVESSLSLPRDKVMMVCEEASMSPLRYDSSPRPHNATLTNGISKPPFTQTTNSRPSPRSLFRTTDVYTWDNNLRSVSRASSAAGTQVRIPVPGAERISSGRSSRASNGQRITWSDTMSVGSTGAGANRRSSLKPSVRDLTIAGPNSVLKVSCSGSLPLSSEGKLSRAGADQIVDQEPTPNQIPDTFHEPHNPFQEPQERPPSRADSQEHSWGEEGDSPVLARSIRIPVPDHRAKGRCDTFREAEPESPRQGKQEEKDSGGSAMIKGSQASPTSPHLARSPRRKQQATWRTMKRRLKLAEDRKRTTSPKANTKQTHNKKEAAARASYEQWLQKKREEKERQDDSSEEESSSDAEDQEARSAENGRAFNDWLKDLKERPHRGPFPFTPASLHRRKSRPLKNLIQVGGNREETMATPDPDSYMTAYQEWRRGKTSTDSEEQPISPRDLKDAKRRVEEKRKSLLAAALTYEDWMDHTQQRQHLMQAVLRADSNKLNSVDQTILSRRAPRQMSFTEWRQRMGKREAELRDQEKERMRKQTEPYHDKHGFLVNDDSIRSSAAIPHEEWLKRKSEDKNKHDKKAASKSGSQDSRLSHQKKGASELNRSVDNSSQGGSVLVSEGGKETAWEMWLQRKHQNEMEELSRHMCEGKQLVQNVHQGKTSRVT